MKQLFFILVSVCVLPALGRAESDAQPFWPQWRGPNGNGVALKGDPPVKWSEEENVRWKVDLGGGGHATPIVWGDRIFVSVAAQTDEAAVREGRRGRRGGEARGRGGRGGRGGDVGRGGRRGGRGGGRGGRGGGSGVQPTHVLRFEVLALDRKTGQEVWRQVAGEEMPHTGRKAEGSWASPSGVTDGEHLFAFFGSYGLYCYDLDGNLKWQKDFGDLQVYRGFGEGSSPALFGNTLVVNWDHEEGSFIVALDKATGKELWRNGRDEGTTWSTPSIVDRGGKPQVIVPATYKNRGYDLATGALVWEGPGLTRNVIPAPVYADGIVYLMSGYRGNAVQAIDLDKAKGDITGSDAIVWTLDRDTPYVSSPLLYDNYLYFFKSNNAILSCFDARTGEAHFGPVRLEGARGFYASPVGANGRVYLASQNGATLVIKHGSEFEVLATNVLDESFNASPVVVDKELYLRGARYLYCIAAD